MKAFSFKNVDFGGFWKNRTELNRTATVKTVYDRFVDTGRFEAFKFNWKEGMDFKPHIFWDSDVAKWMEGAAYTLVKHPDPELKAELERVIDLIEKNQGDDGYFNIYYTVCEPENRFTNRMQHELYCAGHLIEAAVAYYEATGEDKFLNCMKKYADYIDEVFRVKQAAAFSTPGHEEIELALVRLADCTGEEKYLELSRWFVNTRGCSKADKNSPYLISQAYAQSHLPVREQFTAEGHSVRAAYLYCAMADLALRDNDEGLLNACRRLFENITQKRMYITGGIGSASRGEAFSDDFDLPNAEAYSESCAAIGLALFAKRMSLIEPCSAYADAAERALYNGIMASTSLKGNAYFYEDPLEIDLKRRETVKKFHNPDFHFPITQRLEVFGCSCCPPNIVRFFASVGDLFYSFDDSALYVHQYGENTAVQDGIKITQHTDYPIGGKIVITAEGLGSRRLALRYPGWCNDCTLKVNGAFTYGEIHSGYIYLEINDGDEVELTLDMTPFTVYADPRVQNNVGRVAVQRGPVIYCLEGKDHSAPLNSLLLKNTDFEEVFDNELGALTLVTEGAWLAGGSELYSREKSVEEPRRLTFIPYCTFANRGETDMLVWVRDGR